MRILLLAYAVSLYAGEIDKLSFLAGCWAGPGTYEMWMKPEAGSALGVSRTVRNGKVVATEFFLLSETDSVVTLSVQLRQGANPASFRAKEITATSVIFENPEHDFPQRIIYRRQPDGSLLGRIEGVSKGKERGIDYPMKRARCD